LAEPADDGLPGKGAMGSTMGTGPTFGARLQRRFASNVGFKNCPGIKAPVAGFG